MVMSGGGRQPLVTRQMTGGTPLAPSADQVDEAYAESLGITGEGPDALEALRAVDAETLNEGLDLEAVFTMAFGCVIAELQDPAGYDPACRPSLAGTPMIDGSLVAGTPQDVFLAGANHAVPIVIGTTAADLPEFFPPRVTDPYPFFGDDARAARRHYALPFLAQAALLLKGQSGLRDLLPVASIGADMTMHEPARFVAREMTAQGQPAWLYRFTYTAESTRPEAAKQSHAGELPFLFDTLGARYGDAVTDADRRAAGAFNAYVADFVRTGDPNGGGLPTWPRFDPDAIDLMDFSLDDGPVFGRDDRADGIAMVERALDREADPGT
jgi:para-nitrobenzyl esterase